MTESGDPAPTEPTVPTVPTASEVRTRDDTSAVYGSVLAATVVVSAGDLRAPVTLAVLLVVSGLVFWLAHVYAQTVSMKHGGWRLGPIRHSMREEWPVAFAALPPAAAALTGLIPGIAVTQGVWAALGVAILEQQLWGFAAVRNSKVAGAERTAAILLNAFMGVVIITLKVLVNR